jgi:ATP phosphoribosyltransferase regulatory subunit
VEPQHLFPAETLLDLYGEDVRTRVFVFGDAGWGGELCLRPDFTVPVALAHGAAGWETPAAYAYRGPVFRRQAPGAARPVEYLQAGVESFGGLDPARADARTLALILRGLEGAGVPASRVRTGDLGIIFALLDALEMPAFRKRRLRRHIWRPARFHALLEGFVAGPPAPSPLRAGLMQAAATGAGAVEALARTAGEPVGARGLDEVAERAAALAEEAATPPMPGEQAALVEAVLAVSGPSGGCLARLRRLTAEAGVDITPALERLEARLDALNRIGIDAEELPFDASFGRNLEYYDGFVFEILAEGRDDLPPLAGGGRYDAMTARLGAARPVPAVGGMIRPEAALAAREGAA